MHRQADPDEETTDWRAVCGRTARTVRRAGRAKALPDPYQDLIQIDIVAHSLGCRVILEVMNKLAAEKQTLSAVFRGVCLMAAAVPLYMVDDGGHLRSGAELPTRLLVLHSYDDWVLAATFPLGQTLGGEGFFPGALGRYGAPTGLPRPGGKLMSLGHTQYWKSESISSEVASFLGLEPLYQPLEHSTPERELAVPP